MSDPQAVTVLDRILQNLRAVIRNEDAGRTFNNTYEYAVQAAFPNHTLDLLPTDATVAPPLPSGVPYAPALAGTFCTPGPGTLAYVLFANGVSTKPIVIGFNLVLPTSSTVDASGTLNLGPSASGVNIAGAVGFALRSGDVVSHNGFTGPIVFVSAGTPGTTPIAGQSKVKV